MNSNHEQEVGHRRKHSLGRGLLFVISLLYIWVSVNPFENLALPPVPNAAINQLIGAVLAMVLLVSCALSGQLPLVLRPYRWVLLTFGWLALCSIIAVNPVSALQRLLFTFLLALMMSILLVMPRDKAQFSRWLAAFAIALLALCYLGVVLWAERSVHQAYDLAEPQLAGDWRGIFNHKNTAAPAMIILVMMGLFLRKSWSNIGGTLIALLALIFLYETNGKTAAMLLPVTLVFVWLLERKPRYVPLMPAIVLAGMSFLVIGASFSPQLRAFVDALGIDSTFTGRTDIWRLSMETVPQSLIFGQGFQSFWQSDALLGTAGYSSTWAVTAAHAHNAYIEALLNGGIIGLVLVLIWLVFLPARNLASALEHSADCDLNRLFARIWLFSILAACLESSFFTGNGAAWASMLLATFGLHMQANAVLR